jgi:hypothetical protein
MDIQSQSDQILAYLQTGKSITPIGALRKFKCFRLGARVWDLKQAGHPIQSRMIEVQGKRVASYSIER